VEQPLSNFNRNELLADVRAAFTQLETAISTVNPERCRPYVSPELYEQLVGTVRDLTHQGHRRVHGAFEILSADILDPGAAATQSPVRATVRLHATSTLVELDRHDQVVYGARDLMAWTQDLVAAREEGARRWIISELGPMSVQGPVAGPSGPPVETRSLSEQELRERANELERAAGFVRATLTFMHFQGHW
jgi:predicted lipid-binding transport protein (Tim44 family)